MPRAKKVEVNEIAEGATAASEKINQVLTETASFSNDMSPEKAWMLDNAYNYLAPGDSLIAAIAKHGPENLLKCLVTVGVKDQNGAMKTIRNLMRQLTIDTHYRFYNIARQEARNNPEGMGVNGVDDFRGIDDLREVFGEYPAGEENIPTPNEQIELLQDMHCMLNAVYVQLQRVKFSWNKQFQCSDLPYHWRMDEQSNDYRESGSLEEAFAILDQRMVKREEEQRQRQSDALAALEALSL